MSFEVELAKLQFERNQKYIPYKDTGTGSCTPDYRWTLWNAGELGTRTKMATRRRFSFEGFLRLLETSENILHSARYDNSEFLFRRLDAHERTLSTLLHRIEETFLKYTILLATSNLRSHYESRFFLSLERDSDEHLPTIVSNSLNRRDQGAGPDRPRVHVTREQLQSLNEDAGFT